MPTDLPDESLEEVERGAADRLTFFSDAVVAIAMTLLALELPLPGGKTAAELWHFRSMDIWPDLLTQVAAQHRVDRTLAGRHRRRPVASGEPRHGVATVGGRREVLGADPSQVLSGSFPSLGLLA